MILLLYFRFIAVHFPYKYPTCLTKGRAKRIIVVIWMMAVCWSLLGIVRWDKPSPNKPLLVNICAQDNVNYDLASFAFYVVVLIIMSVQYVHIIKVVRRQIRTIEQNTPKLQPSPDIYLMKFQTSPNGIRRDSPCYMWTHTQQVFAHRFLIVRQKTQSPLRNRLHKEIKATKTIVCVFMAFCLCWLPAAIFTTIHFVDEEFFKKLNESEPMTTAVLYFAFVDIFPAINTMVNPLIYSFSNSYFRSSLRDMWKTLRRKASRRLRMDSSHLSSSRSTSRSTSRSSSRSTSRPTSISLPGRIRSSTSILGGSSSSARMCSTTSFSGGICLSSSMSNRVRSAISLPDRIRTSFSN